MGKGTSFKPGSLEREIAIRGLSLQAFSEQAGVDNETVTRAIRGRKLHTKTFGKILVALGAIPVVDGPVELVKTA